eukprot:scaffold12567_cov55-Phaeocystis_antarctica.AAC.7
MGGWLSLPPTLPPAAVAEEDREVISLRMAVIPAGRLRGALQSCSVLCISRKRRMQESRPVR